MADGGLKTLPHLNPAVHKELLHKGAVGLIQAGVVQPDAELHRVPQLRVLQHAGLCSGTSADTSATSALKRTSGHSVVAFCIRTQGLCRISCSLCGQGMLAPMRAQCAKRQEHCSTSGGSCYFCFSQQLKDVTSS